MNEFMMLFRHTPNPSFVPTQEQIEAEIKKWQDWIGGIAAQGKFDQTNQLGYEGKTVKSDGLVTDGPYAELKEIVGGYIIVKTKDLNEAVELATGCPIFERGGNVEVRPIIKM